MWQIDRIKVDSPSVFSRLFMFELFLDFVVSPVVMFLVLWSHPLRLA